MIALYIIGGLIALIVLLLSSPISLRFVFSQNEPQLVLRVWGVPTQLLPCAEKKEKAPARTVRKPPKRGLKKKKEKPSLLAELQTSLKEDGVSAIVKLMGELAGILKRTVGRLLRAITVKKFHLHMRISGEDVSAAAQNYGRVCAAFYPLFGALNGVMKFKKQDVNLYADFFEQGTAVSVEVVARVSLWKVMGAALSTAFSLLKMYVGSTVNDKTEGMEKSNGRE